MARRPILLLVAAAGLLALGPATARADAPLPLHLVRSISLGSVAGRLDHLALDRSGHRLFVAATGDDSVLVIDLERHALQRVLGDLAEPHGLAFLPDLEVLAVSNGGDGTLRLFQGPSLQPVHTVNLGSAADDVRVDSRTGTLLVGLGADAIALVDAKTGLHLGDLQLPGRPEAFSLQGNGSRILVNVPSSGSVVVLDRIEARRVATWPLGPGHSNFPMALDASHHRLFVGLREPPGLAVLDAKTGHQVALLGAPGDADDLFYDAALQRIYLAAGTGVVAVYGQIDADHYDRVASVPTRAGARTALFDPALDRLFVAAPRRAGAAAQILVFAPQP